MTDSNKQHPRLHEYIKLINERIENAKHNNLNCIQYVEMYTIPRWPNPYSTTFSQTIIDQFPTNGSNPQFIAPFFLRRLRKHYTQLGYEWHHDDMDYHSPHTISWTNTNQYNNKDDNDMIDAQHAKKLTNENIQQIVQLHIGHTNRRISQAIDNGLYMIENPDQYVESKQVEFQHFDDTVITIPQNGLIILQKYYRDKHYDWNTDESTNTHTLSWGD